MSNRKKIKPTTANNDKDAQEIVKLREQVTSLANKNHEDMNLIAKVQGKQMDPLMVLNMRLSLLAQHVFGKEEEFLRYELHVQQELREAIDGVGELDVPESGKLYVAGQGE